MPASITTTAWKRHEGHKTRLQLLSSVVLCTPKDINSSAAKMVQLSVQSALVVLLGIASGARVSKGPAVNADTLDMMASFEGFYDTPCAYCGRFSIRFL